MTKWTIINGAWRQVWVDVRLVDGRVVEEVKARKEVA